MMHSLCDVCAAGDMCPCFGLFDDGSRDRCDDILAAMVEEAREEYRNAWREYVRDNEEEMRFIRFV